MIAPTGSGKSTTLPGWMAEECSKPVLVVEPRRVACRSLASYLSELAGEEVGRTYGYRVRFDESFSKDTKVLFVTTGVALQILAGKEWRDFGAILVDEFHERSWEVDLIAAALLERRRKKLFKGPIVFTSATLETEELSERIGARVIESQGRTFPVAISYQEDQVLPSQEGLDGRVERALRSALRNDDQGEVLVFLPGKGEISSLESTLQGLAREKNLELIPVHGSLPPEYLLRAFGKPKEGTQRVFLATNVAETSLTLPGVTLVIDSGLARMRIHRSGRSALALVPISRASMDQRSGRAGRVQAGRCIRLFSSRFRPQEENKPEIERIELDDLILQAGLSGLDGPLFDRALWLSRPPEFAVKEARERLQRMEALDQKFRLTEKGRVMASLPVGGDEARILLEPPHELASTAADVVALLQGRGDLLLPLSLLGGRQESVKEARSELFAGVDNEVFLQIRALRSGEAHSHGLHKSALEETRKIGARLRKILGVTPLRPDKDQSGLPERKDLVAFLLERIPEAAFVVRKRALTRRIEGRAPRGKSEPWANGEIELSIWPFRSPGLAATGREKNSDPVAGIVLDHFWLGDGGAGVRGTGRLVLPCTYGELRDAELGVEEVSLVRAGYERGHPFVRAQVHRTLAGVVLESGELGLRGRSLCREAGRAILDGALLKGSAEILREDLHVWDLMARWPDLDRNWEGREGPGESVDYMEERLWNLGIRRAEDLLLVEVDDLRPDLPALLGAYRFDIDSMKEEFPSIWEHLGSRYFCEVRPLAREVILTPCDKKTSRREDPKDRFLPRFRGFKVTYLNASRRIVIRK